MLAILDLPYSLDLTEEGWDKEPFPINQLLKTFQLHNLNKCPAMVFIIFCTHELTSTYAKCLKQDPAKLEHALEVMPGVLHPTVAGLECVCLMRCTQRYTHSP